MAGRKPKPTAVKKLEGNPGKRKLNTKEPVPGNAAPFVKGGSAGSAYQLDGASDHWYTTGYV